MQGCCKPFKNPLQEHRQVAGYLQGGGRRKEFPTSNPKAKPAPTLYFPHCFPLFPASKLILQISMRKNLPYFPIRLILKEVNGE